MAAEIADSGGAWCTRILIGRPYAAAECSLANTGRSCGCGPRFGPYEGQSDETKNGLWNYVARIATVDRRVRLSGAT